MFRVIDMPQMKYVNQFILSQLLLLCLLCVVMFLCFGYRFLKEMPRKATGETYVWDHAKEKIFLEKLDYHLACSGGKHPPLATLDLWAAEFNAEFGGVPAYSITLYQKKERMKKIYRGWKALQCRTGLGYDPLTDRVICSDDTWQSFIKVIKIHSTKWHVLYFF